jgi:hypothetical protein
MLNAYFSDIYGFGVFSRNAYKCADTASTPAQSRQICLYARNEKREHETGNLLCLSKRDNEFQQQNVAWDIQATYVLADGPSVNQGILVRLNDNKMLVPDIQVWRCPGLQVSECALCFFQKVKGLTVFHMVESVAAYQ